MAVNINRPFMNNTCLNENNCFSNLIHQISPNIENERDIINTLHIIMIMILGTY